MLSTVIKSKELVVRAQWYMLHLFVAFTGIEIAISVRTTTALVKKRLTNTITLRISRLLLVFKVTELKHYQRST